MGADLIIRGGLVWPGAGFEPVVDGAVAVSGQRIERLAPFSHLQGAIARAVVLGGPDRLVMPGLINGHTHLAMVLFRGLADDLPLMDWLEKHIWPAEARAVSEEMVYWCGLLGLAEMLRNGTTTLADGYFCEAGAIKAVEEAGLRAVLAQGIIDFPAPGAPDPGEKFSLARRFLEAGRHLPDRIRLGLFCHSPYTCSPQTLLEAKALTQDFGVLCFIHLAETEAETELVLKNHGQRPAAFLDDLGFLDQSTVVVHAVHLNHGEIELLARRGVGAVTCPESQMKLASGRAEVKKWLEVGLRTGLGTDGAASNNDLNLFGEMGALARWHKGASGDPTTLPAEAVLRAATAGGAEVLGLGQVGRLAPGWAADVITLDLTQPNLMPLFNLPAQLVYAAQGGEVREVVVAGKVLLAEGELQTIDLATVRAEVVRLSEKLG